MYAAKILHSAQTGDRSKNRHHLRFTIHIPFRFPSYVSLKGKFLQTCQIAGNWYGVTREAVESVAREGLAAVFHMDLEVINSRCLFPVNESLNALTAVLRPCFSCIQFKIEFDHKKVNLSKASGL